MYVSHYMTIFIVEQCRNALTIGFSLLGLKYSYFDNTCVKWKYLSTLLHIPFLNVEKKLIDIWAETWETVAIKAKYYGWVIFYKNNLNCKVK